MINSAESDKGKKTFHVKDISRSYRIRGRVARIQTNRAASNRVFSVRSSSENKIVGELRNKVAESRLIIKILIYSAIKIRANVPALNSVLKPETSSDSPSAKSKGVRLVSANVEINHIAKTGGIMRARGCWVVVSKCEKSKEKKKRRALIKRSLILTS